MMKVLKNWSYVAAGIAGIFVGATIVTYIPPVARDLALEEQGGKTALIRWSDVPQRPGQKPHRTYWSVVVLFDHRYNCDVALREFSGKVNGAGGMCVPAYETKLLEKY